VVDTVTPTANLDADARSSTRTVAVVAVVFVAASTIAAWTWITSSLTESGDTAADSIRARTAWSETSGVFSRWDFHHPGPALFWLKWVGTTLGDAMPGVGLFGGQMLVLACFAATAAALLAWVLIEATGRWFAGLAVFPLLAVFGGGTQVAVWAPSVAHWCVIAGIAATAATSFGRRWALPVAVFAGVTAIHMHLLYLLPGLTVLAGAGVGRWLMRDRYTDRRDITAAGMVGGVLVLPMVAAIVAGDAYWSDYFGRPEGSTEFRSPDAAIRSLLTSVTQFDAFTNPTPAIITMLAVVACGVWVVVHHRRDVVGFVAWCGLAWLAWLTVTSPLDFLTQATGGPIVAVLLVAPFLTDLEVRWSPAATFAVCAATIGLATVPYIADPERTATDAYNDYLELANGDEVLLMVDHATTPWDAYTAAAGITLLALREDSPVCVLERRWPFWVEPEHICGPLPERVVLVTFTARHEYTIDIYRR
jgi:hypothetical protein